MASSRSDPRQMMRQVVESEFNDVSSSHDDDNSISHGEGGSRREEQPKLAENKEFSAKDAARATNCVGYVVLCLLIFTGGILSILTHFYVQGEEDEEFKNGVRMLLHWFSDAFLKSNHFVGPSV